MKLMPKNFLPLATAIFLLTGLVYTAVQQTIRLSAYNPQIQLSEDAAAKLAKEESAQSVLANLPDVDAAYSLAPFVVIYDDAGNPVAGSGKFGGDFKTPPKGVFAATKATGQDRFTWQTDTGLRFATIVTSTGTGRPLYVLAARNMREAEALIQHILALCIAGGLVTWGAVWFVMQVQRQAKHKD